MEPSDQPAQLVLRIPARPSHSALLRAQLRLWLLANQAGDPAEVVDVLASATRAFLLALHRPGPVRTLAIQVDASIAAGAVEIAVHDHAGRLPNTVRFRHLVSAPREPRPVAPAQPLP